MNWYVTCSSCPSYHCLAVNAGTCIQHRVSVQEMYMQEFVDRCGHMARMFSIGKSKQNRDMWALELSNNPGATEAKPNARYIGNMHGDEPASRCCSHAGPLVSCSGHVSAHHASVSCTPIASQLKIAFHWGDRPGTMRAEWLYMW